MREEEYILCAAIRRIKPRDCINPYHANTNDILNIELGFRHHDIFRRFENEVSSNPKDQGFYTSKGRFVSRREAMEIAYKAGQIKAEVAIGNLNNCHPLKIHSHEEGLKITFTGSNPIPEWNPLCTEDLY